MITIFQNQNDTILASNIGHNDPVPDNAVWIDLEYPTPEEELSLKEHLGICIPSREEVWKNHVLNRLYTENGVSYMTAALINKVNTPYPQTSAVIFILTAKQLVTIRHISPTSFKNFIYRIQHTPQRFSHGAEVLEGLLEEVITRVAYNSEVVIDELDRLSHQVFDGKTPDGKELDNASGHMKDALKKLGACADLNSKINESLHSVSRMLSFFRELERDKPLLKADIDILVTDAQALTQQTAFLSDKITFQLDATLGMINVEQNMIIKIFSVVAVFFLPPTMVSSIYGMNFVNMPELHWSAGYPLAIVLMAIFAIVPYIYFRKRQWL